MKHFSDCSTTKDMPLSCTIKSVSLSSHVFSSARRRLHECEALSEGEIASHELCFRDVLLESYLRPLQVMGVYLSRRPYFDTDWRQIWVAREIEN